MPDPSETPETDPENGSTPDEAPADEPVFTNRAARRAKGKGKSGSPQASHDQSQHFGGRGSVQGPRQWGNRRSG